MRRLVLVLLAACGGLVAREPGDAGGHREAAPLAEHVGDAGNPFLLDASDPYDPAFPHPRVHPSGNPPPHQHR